MIVPVASTADSPDDRGPSMPRPMPSAPSPRVLVVLIAAASPSARRPATRLARRQVRPIATRPAIPGSPRISTSSIGLYKHLHTHPELSFQEHETAKRIAAELEKAGAEVTPGVGKLGVVGVLKNGPGPVVLVRTDMDALPVAEETGLPYASRQTATDKAGRLVGVMHACGHDVHMTCFVGTARWLAEHRTAGRGPCVFVASRPRRRSAVPGRCSMTASIPASPGPISPWRCIARPTSRPGPSTTAPGPMLASSTSVTITIRGKGGHGAWPHRTVDPIVLAALVVVDLQTIVSREIEPIQPAVVTVGSIHGGTKHNIIPDEVKLQLTLRTFSEPVRQQLIDGHPAPRRGPGQGPPGPRADRRGRGVDPADDQYARAWSNASCRPSSRRSAPTGSRRPTPVMGAEDFGLFGEDGRADLHVLAGDDRSRPDRGGASRRTRTCRPSTRPSITPTPSRASRPASAP